MSKKKSKKRQAIDKVFEEMGITPVPPDHPIYKMGPTIRLISRLPKRKMIMNNDDIPKEDIDWINHLMRVEELFFKNGKRLDHFKNRQKFSVTT